MFHVKHDVGAWCLCVCMCGLLGCPAEGPGGEDAGEDAGDDAGATDGGDASDAARDAGEDASRGEDVGADAAQDTGGGGDAGEGGLPTTCDAACREQTAQVTFGEVTERVELGFYGLNAPDEDGARTLYIELHGDASTACPSQDSPTPGRTLILGGLPLPLEERAYATPGDALRGTFFDYEGTLLPGIAPASATEVTVTPRAANVCAAPECEGVQDADGFVALDVSVAFEGGDLSGSVYLTHCTSYDE